MSLTSYLQRFFGAHPEPREVTEADLIDVGAAVERIEPLLMPRFEKLAAELSAASSDWIVETCSHRHAICVQVFGVTCRPLGTEVTDPQTIALTVNIHGVRRLSYTSHII